MSQARGRQGDRLQRSGGRDEFGGNITCMFDGTIRLNVAGDCTTGSPTLAIDHTVDFVGR